MQNTRRITKPGKKLQSLSIKGLQHNYNTPRTLCSAETDRGTKIVLEVQIQGHRIRALLDSNTISNYISPGIVNHYYLP